MTFFRVMFVFLFLFCVCICYRFVVCAYHEVYVYVYDCFRLLMSYFQCILTTLYFYPLHSWLLFLMSYFTSNCFVYPLTVYCWYRWFHYFCLLSFLLALCMDDFLPLLYVCVYKWVFHLVIFMFLVVAFSFILREFPLPFLVKLVW